MRVPRRPRSLRRPGLLLALALTGCLDNCAEAIGPDGSPATPYALVTVDDAAPPAVVHADSARTVRVVADTIRLYPRLLRYDRRSTFEVTPAAGGAPVRIAHPVPSRLESMRDAATAAEPAWLLDLHFVAPDVAPAQGHWRWRAGGDTVVVEVREWRVDEPGRLLYTAAYVPVGPR